MDIPTIIKHLSDALRVQSLQDSLLAMPSDMVVTSVEGHQNEPNRPRGLLGFHTLDSLFEYVEKHQEPQQTAIFASLDDLTIQGVMNWHSGDPSAPGWGDHIASYRLQHTREYLAWMGINARPIEQSTFLEFLEENMQDVTQPAPLDLFESITRLQGKRNTTFEMARRVDNGDIAIEWKEDTVTNNGSFPSRFTIRIPVFRGAESDSTFDINVILRYRIKEGRLSFEVKLLHVEKIRDLAFAEICENITTRVTAWETGVPCYSGAIRKTP